MIITSKGLQPRFLKDLLAFDTRSKHGHEEEVP
jgi:hypothetical protein